jgi:hypothetical protein
VKWICKYLRGTSRIYLCFENGKHVLARFTIANMVGDIEYSSLFQGT